MYDKLNLYKNKKCDNFGYYTNYGYLNKQIYPLFTDKYNLNSNIKFNPIIKSNKFYNEITKENYINNKIY